jgi:SAM-dependent methyltransferase
VSAFVDGLTSGWLENFCEGIPGITRTGEAAWAITDNTAVSYPQDGLNVLARIEDDSYWFHHRNAVIAAVVRRHPPPGVILDIGGGNGFVARGLLQAGFPSVVVEPDASGIRVAQSRGLPTIKAALDHLPLPAGSVPAAGMFDVLEHIEDDEGALRRLFAALRPGGILYVAVPALSFLWSGADVHAGHFRRYTTKTLSERAEAAGFTVLFRTYFFEALVPAIFLFRTLRRHLGVPSDTGDRTGTSDHALPRGIMGSYLPASLSRELRSVEAGQSPGRGSSCLIVAQKR